MRRIKDILVVGAGFAGAVYARELAERGWRVTVIDRRRHVGGNAYDELTWRGERVHRYGPHFLHTNNERVVTWLGRFSSFVRYEHRVTVMLPDGRFVPFPRNRATVNEVFRVQLITPDEVKTFLAGECCAIPLPRNAAERLVASVGRTLTNLLFRPYTERMWGVALEELSPKIVERVSARFDDEDRYFASEKFQLLPTHGYNCLINNILAHENINVCLNQGFAGDSLGDFVHCFNSMAIDEYFGYCFEQLPYRSIRFHSSDVAKEECTGPTAVVNYSECGQFTRGTEWGRLPNSAVDDSHPMRTITYEDPCSDRDNGMERYYPIARSDDRISIILEKYKLLAAQEPKITFIGRCGTYRYLDMHQVIGQSLLGAHKWSVANS